MIFCQIWAIETDGAIDLENQFLRKENAQFWLEQARREHPENVHEIVTSYTTEWKRVPNA